MKAIFTILIVSLGLLYTKSENSIIEICTPIVLTENQFKNESIVQYKNENMSDYTLKFWPEENVKETKTEEIISELTKSQIIGKSTEFWGKPAFEPGKNINDYFEPKLSEEWAKYIFQLLQF